MEKNSDTKGKGVKTDVFDVFTDKSEDQTQNINKERVMNSKDVAAPKRAGAINDKKGERAVAEIPLEFLFVEYHPRKNLGDLTSLQGSIKRDGLQEPILVYEAGENQYGVIDGCRRLTAIQEFGWKSVPCLINKNIGARDAAHLSYVKNSERNNFDPIEVAMHLKAMMERFGYSMRDLEIKGYGSPASISNKMKLLELTESVQKKIQGGELTIAHGLQLIRLPNKKEQERMAKRVVDEDLSAKRTESQIGRYLAKGKRKNERPKAQIPETDIPGVYIKDSRDMSELPDESVHLIVSSPPYGVGMEYEKGVTFDEHVEMIQGVLKECARVLAKGGTIGLNVGDIHCFKGRNGKSDFSQFELMGHRYQTWLRRYGIFLTDIIIWLKRTPSWSKRPDIHFTDVAHTAYKLLPNFEPVYIFRKRGERETPPEDVVLKSRLTKEQWVAWTPSVWEIKPVQKMEGHPSIYPDELCLRLIKMFSYEGDTVLDPWLGSGTTVKVARELNRIGIGYEKEPQYKEVIMIRLGVPLSEGGQEDIEKKIESLQEVFESATGGKDEIPTPVRVEDKEAKDSQRLEHADGYLEAEAGEAG